jgi:hypothetical protein
MIDPDAWPSRWAGDTECNPALLLKPDASALPGEIAEQPQAWTHPSEPDHNAP